MDEASDERFTLRDILQLGPFIAGSPQQLSPDPLPHRTIRWTHIIGQDRPATMLQGGELVLSTLPRLSEQRADLVAALQDYLTDLDTVQAAALAVEVLPDRPRLLSALRALAQHRNSAGHVPIFLFRQVVRFVEITEAVHRELVSRQLSSAAEKSSAADPLLSATTNLLDDLSAPGGLPEAEITARAAALGMRLQAEARESTATASLTALVLRLRGAREGSGASGPIAHLVSMIRAAASSISAPVLIGRQSERAVSVLLAAREPAHLCRALNDQARRRRTRGVVPRYLVAAGELGPRQLIPLRDAPQALNHAADIARAASALLDRAAADPDNSIEHATGGLVGQPRQGFWRAQDLGLLGFLVNALDNPQGYSGRGWFLDHYLSPFRGPEGEELRELARALIIHGSNRTQLAQALQISRPTLYSRLDRFQRVLGHELTTETLTLLHLALSLEQLQDMPSGEPTTRS